MRNPHIRTVFFVVFVATGLFLLGYFIGRAGMPEVVETIKIDTIYYENEASGDFGSAGGGKGRRECDCEEADCGNSTSLVCCGST